MMRSSTLRRVKKILSGKPYEGRVGHFCVNGRCKPALVFDQRKNVVDVKVNTSPKRSTQHRDVVITNARTSKGRSFHLLEQCDKIAIVNGEYADV
jgi:hypothetical protein